MLKSNPTDDPAVKFRDTLSVIEKGAVKDPGPETVPLKAPPDKGPIVPTGISVPKGVLLPDENALAVTVPEPDMTPPMLAWIEVTPGVKFVSVHMAVSVPPVAVETD
jgi:hypothetical protein